MDCCSDGLSNDGNAPCNLNVKHAADPDGLPVMETSTIGRLFVHNQNTSWQRPIQPSSARSTANPSERA